MVKKNRQLHQEAGSPKALNILTQKIYLFTENDFYLESMVKTP